MAKQKKGGLGRGLDALMGSAPKETMMPATEPEKAPAAEKSAVNQPEKKPEPQVDPEKAKELATEAQKKASEQKELPVKRINPAEAAQIVSEAPYEISEDKTTIKGVRSREVPPEQRQQQNAKPEPKKDPVEEKATDELDINLIIPNPEQPRKNFKKEELEELAESIGKTGLLQPIVVRKAGDQYQIIAGERRYQACNIAGLKKVPVRIMDADDNEALIMAMIENVQRTDLNPIEEAYGYRVMMERGKMTQTQVAQAVSKGRSTIANSLRLLELPEEAQQLLFEEKITAGHARAILSVPSKENRAKLTKKLAEEQLSVRETEAIARLLAGKNEKKSKTTTATPKSYKTVARSLREALQTDVRVKSVKGKNKIEIVFKDEADLERLYRVMTSE